MSLPLTELQRHIRGIAPHLTISFGDSGVWTFASSQVGADGLVLAAGVTRDHQGQWLTLQVELTDDANNGCGWTAYAR